jgi:cyclopropane fatty-acyl-phospholipid synthase-like methyltransferase
LLSKSYKTQYELLFQDYLTKKEKGYFDEAALPSYTHSNKLMSFLFWKRIETVFNMAGNIQNCSVLDFGCGGGVTFKYFHANGCTITGCDNQHNQLAEKVCDDFNIHATINEDLFKIDDKFDRIFALDVLEHVDEIEKYIAKLKALLCEGGQILVSGPTENFLYKMGRALAGFSGHYHVRNIYDIEECFEKLGLLRTQVRSLYPIAPLFRISLWEKKCG